MPVVSLAHEVPPGWPPCTGLNADNQHYVR